MQWGLIAVIVFPVAACSTRLAKREAPPPPSVKVEVEGVRPVPSVPPSPRPPAVAKKPASQPALEKLEQPPPTKPRELEAPRVERVEPSQPKEKPKYVSLNFDSVDLDLVLKAFADITGFNFVVAPGVKAQITLHTVNKVPTSEALAILEAVLEVHNLTALKKGPIYQIVPVAMAQQQAPEVRVKGWGEAELGGQLITQVVPLEVASAEELARVLQPLLVKGTKVVTHKAANALVVSGFTSTVKKLLDLVTALDKPSPLGPEQRVFVYYVKNADAKKLAEILNALYGRKEARLEVRPGAPPGRPTPQPPGAPPAQQPPSPLAPPTAEVVGELTVVADEATNSLVIRTAPQNWAIIEETIKKLDIVPKQVVIELLIAELTLRDQLQYGLEFFLKAGEFVLQQSFGLTPIPGPGTGATNLGTPFSRLPTPFVPQLPGITFTFVDRDRFFGLLTSADIFNKLKVLATPHILAADNKEARIQVGREVPIIVGETSSLTTATTAAATSGIFRSLQQRDIGVIMRIKPHVNEERQVTLDIEQEVSDIEFASFGNTGSPSFTKRTTKNSVVVPDKQTLIIGGIIQDTHRREYTGIPLLDRIPILGALFRSETDTVERTELIVLVTPHVIASPEEATAITKSFEERVKALQQQLEQARKREKS